MPINEDKRYLDLEGLTHFKEKLDDTYVKVSGSTFTGKTMGFWQFSANSDGLVTGVTPVDQVALAAAGAYAAPVSSGKVYLVGAASVSGATTLNSNANIYFNNGKLYVGPNETDEVARKSDVAKAVEFKGTVGTGGTITTLPAASAALNGNMYIVCSDGTYAGIKAKTGDVFICGLASGSTTTYTWHLIPSGDEPGGTVTSVAAGDCLTTGSTNPITSTGTISHAKMTVNGATQPASDPAAVGVGVDAYGHAIIGKALYTQQDNHSHTVSGGTVSVPSITVTPKKYKISVTSATNVITGYAGQKKNLQRVNIYEAKNVADGDRPTKTAFTPVTTHKLNDSYTTTIINPIVAGSSITVYGFSNAIVQPVAVSYATDTYTLNLSPITIVPSSFNPAVETATASRITLGAAFSSVTASSITSNTAVNVAVASTTPTAVATGIVTDGGDGAEVMIGLGTASTITVVTDASISEATDGIQFITAVSSTPTTETVQGITIAGGEHTHTIAVSTTTV